jgi:RNA binding exosome subunit
MNQINDMITQNQKLFEENMQLEGHYGNMVNQYEYSNKRNAETQTFDK